MPVFDEESHGDFCSVLAHSARIYTVLNKLPAARARALYALSFMRCRCLLRHTKDADDTTELGRIR